MVKSNFPKGVTPYIKDKGKVGSFTRPSGEDSKPQWTDADNAYRLAVRGGKMPVWVANDYRLIEVPVYGGTGESFDVPSAFRIRAHIGEAPTIVGWRHIKKPGACLKAWRKGVEAREEHRKVDQRAAQEKAFCDILKSMGWAQTRENIEFLRKESERAAKELAGK